VVAEALKEEIVGAAGSAVVDTYVLLLTDAPSAFVTVTDRATPLGQSNIAGIEDSGSPGKDCSSTHNFSRRKRSLGEI